MNTRKGPMSLADQLLKRSTHSRFQVTAVIFDNRGIFAWGWNHAKQHAEIHAIKRSNRRRLLGATMIVLGRKKQSGNSLMTRPCPDCEKHIIAAGIAAVYHSTYNPADPKTYNFTKLVPQLATPRA